ncbi:MAG: SOS response-associated peptidase [Flavobacteriia bacterium]|nr:SOS response-associated peptidase [Flavobacteriia bacterium]
MCGRYVTVSKVKAVEKRFNAEVATPDLWHINTNVGPGSKAPVIANESPNSIQHFQFGFTPQWAKKPMYVFNARSEGDHNKDNNPSYTGAKGILQKPMFRKSIRDKRCLVLADAFIEGPEKEKLSKPYVVYLKERRPFAFAGVWDEWVNTDTGEILRSFAILTTVANPLMQKIGHHRSPVILEPDQESDWLSNDLPIQDVTAMLEPYDAKRMNAYPIDPAIKNPRAQGIELLKPTGERVFKEYDYEIYEELRLEGMGETRARQRGREEKDGQQSLF